MGVPEDHVARVNPKPLDDLAGRAQPGTAELRRRELAAQRPQASGVQRTHRPREDQRKCPGAQRAGAPRPQRGPGLHRAPALDRLGRSSALCGGMDPRVDRRDDGLVVVH